jgi:predicted N-acetyltransferase YhbS
MEIKNYKEGDEHKIMELFELVFKQKMTLSYWNWRFRDNPCGNYQISLMWDEDKLVGHYAASPVELLIEDKVFKSALSMTTMTHPDYAGKGIFGQLAENLYANLQATNYFGIWGFPNDNSHYGFIKKMDWIDVGICSEIVTSFMVSKDTEKNISEINLFTQDHVDFINKSTSQYKVKVNKSLHYLNWRYLENPNETYTVFEYKEEGEIIGLVVAKKYNDKINIIEFYSKDDAVLIKKLLNAAAQSLMPAKENIEMTLWLSLFDAKYPNFEKVGFRPIGKNTYLGIRPFSNDFPEIKYFNNWNIQFGDSDVY